MSSDLDATARISPVSNGMLHFLRTGVVLILLPLLSVAAGLGIWMTRRG